MNTRFPKTACMVAAAKMLTSNYSIKRIGVCSILHQFTIDFDIQFTMKRVGLF